MWLQLDPRLLFALHPARGCNSKRLFCGRHEWALGGQAGMSPWAGGSVCGQVARRNLLPYTVCVFQVLRYFDYVFTGVFTFEMVIKVRVSRGNLVGLGWVTCLLL